jgi:cation diffusion facilitator family transporter
MDPAPWTHAHAFGTADRSGAESRTRWVVALTLAMMAGEIVAGALFGSMALLADGFHMGTHAAALGVAAFAYAYARRHASDPRFSFGTGKVGALGGFASAIGLAVVAALVLVESARRLASPVAIRFDEAIAVAALGLAVNVVSALLLREGHGHAHGHLHDDSDRDHDRPLTPTLSPASRGRGGKTHEHPDSPASRGRGGKTHEHPDSPASRGRGGPAHEHPDHNLRAAYLHVLADALTSVLALAALAAGKLLGWTRMDPVMGIVGAVVIARWSVGLLRETSAVLLDAEVRPELRRAIAAVVEADGAGRVSDLHVWRVGPRHLAAIVAVVTDAPRAPDHYRRRLEAFGDLVHVTVEVIPAPVR